MYCSWESPSSSELPGPWESASAPRQDVDDLDDELQLRNLMERVHPLQLFFPERVRPLHYFFVFPYNPKRP